MKDKLTTISTLQTDQHAIRRYRCVFLRTGGFDLGPPGQWYVWLENHPVQRITNSADRVMARDENVHVGRDPAANLDVRETSYASERCPSLDADEMTDNDARVRS